MDPTYYVITDGEKYWLSGLIGSWSVDIFTVYRELERTENVLKYLQQTNKDKQVRVQEINLYLGVPD